MKLVELLDELRKNILHDHSDLIAGDSDQLWSDETLLRYIKDAERKFARQAMCIRDGTTPAITQIKLRTGVVQYPVHKAVFAVLSARYDTDQFDIQRSGHALVSQFTPSEVFTYDSVTGYNAQPGRPIAYMTDETLLLAPNKQMTLTVYPAPSATEDGKLLRLRTLRYPNIDYLLSNLNVESEIPEDYQLDCLEWAAYRAQRHNDADGGAATPSDKHKQAFDEAVFNAHKELKRTLFANVTLRYGGNGVSGYVA